MLILLFLSYPQAMQDLCSSNAQIEWQSYMFVKKSLKQILVCENQVFSMAPPLLDFSSNHVHS